MLKNNKKLLVDYLSYFRVKIVNNLEQNNESLESIALIKKALEENKDSSFKKVYKTLNLAR